MRLLVAEIVTAKSPEILVLLSDLTVIIKRARIEVSFCNPAGGNRADHDDITWREFVKSVHSNKSIESELFLA